MGQVVRYAGADRYETSVEVAKVLVDMGADKVAYASGLNFADALTGSAYLVNHPQYALILTNGKELLAGAPDLGGKIIFGGPNSINIPGLEAATRYAGSDRYETALEITKAFGEFDEIILAHGTNYPDALSAVPLAKKLGAPILLTAPTYMKDSVYDYIQENASKAIIVAWAKLSWRVNQDKT